MSQEESRERGTETPKKKINKKCISVPELFNEDEEKLGDDAEPTANLNNKVGKKRQRKSKEKDESAGIEKKTKKKKQDSVLDDQGNSTKINEMWDSITNNKSSKDGDNVVEKQSKKDEDNAEIAKLFMTRKKKSKKEKDKAEIAMQVEQVMANLEIAVEDDAELNKQGKPAINKLIKLPLLNEALSKKPLQSEFLDHGVLNLLKNWLERLPDGSLPNTNIRTAVLKILNDLCILLEQPCRRAQLIKSGLGKVLMFLSKTDEETASNRRLANDLVNRLGHIIYGKSTRYENMCSQEERREHKENLLRRQNKTALKASKTKARDFDIDVDFSEKQKPELETRREAERAKVPTPMSMEFVIRPEPKVDKELEARAKMQIDDKGVHEKIIDKLEKGRALRKRSLQALKISVNGRTEPKY